MAGETISIDEKFLKGFIGKGGKAIDIGSGQQITNQAEADQFLQQHVSSQKTEKLADTTSEDEPRTSRRAERLLYTEKEREQRRLEKERQQRAARQQGIRATEIAIGSVSSGIRPLIDKIGSAPVPGGIGLLIAIIVLLLFVVVQVNAEGDTRLKQFWYMLNGRARLIGAVTPTGTPTTATESTKGVQGNIPMPASGVCPAGYRPFTDSRGFTQCVPDSSSLGTGSGPNISTMALYQLTSSPYRMMTGNIGF